MTKPSANISRTTHPFREEHPILTKRHPLFTTSPPLPALLLRDAVDQRTVRSHNGLCCGHSRILASDGGGFDEGCGEPDRLVPECARVDRAKGGVREQAEGVHADVVGVRGGLRCFWDRELREGVVGAREDCVCVLVHAREGAKLGRPSEEGGRV
jgi:hypothetical protein